MLKMPEKWGSFSGLCEEKGVVDSNSRRASHTSRWPESTYHAGIGWIERTGAELMGGMADLCLHGTSLSVIGVVPYETHREYSRAPRWGNRSAVDDALNALSNDTRISTKCSISVRLGHGKRLNDGTCTDQYYYTRAGSSFNKGFRDQEKIHILPRVVQEQTGD